MRFDSQGAVRQFAGEDYEKACVPTQAGKVLARFEEQAKHYEIKADPEP